MTWGDHSHLYTDVTCARCNFGRETLSSANYTDCGKSIEVGGGGEEPRRECNTSVHTQEHIDAKVPKIRSSSRSIARTWQGQLHCFLAFSTLSDVSFITDTSQVSVVI